VPIRAFPQIRCRDSGILIGQAFASTCGGGRSKPIEAVDIGQQSGTPVDCAGRATVTVQNLARLGRPFVPESTREMLPYSLAEICAFTTDGAIPTQQSLKALLYAHLFAFKTRDRAAHGDRTDTCQDVA
jgi:hypothetical protein